MIIKFKMEKDRFSLLSKEWDAQDLGKDRWKYQFKYRK